ncbi:hypothetical protein GOP47_0027701 [Adiantum capillus-veneris]|nr:hypothetical protein GOP47_0027701 [Adiantum capillus-veneris]
MASETDNKSWRGLFGGKKGRLRKTMSSSDMACRQKNELQGLYANNFNASWERLCLIPRLPNDIAQHCLAKVPRVELTKLRLVCTSWKRLIESKEFYRLRSEVGSAESWLLVLAENPTKTPFKAFCPRGNKWYKMPSVPNSSQTSLWQGFSCVAVGCKLLLMGGIYFDATPQECSSGVVCGDVYVYDASTNKWSKGTSMNTPRSWFAATAIGEYVYVAGGQGKDRFLNSVEVYDTKQDSWSYVLSMRFVRASCYGLALHGKLWVIGGEFVQNRCGDKLERGSAEVYDPFTGFWSVIPEMWLDTQKVPGPGTVHCGKLLFVHQSKLMMYEDERNRWCHVGYLPGGELYSNRFSRFGFAFESVENELYIVGGMRISRQHRYSLQSLNTTEVCKISYKQTFKCTDWRTVVSMGDCEGNVLASAVLRF